MNKIIYIFFIIVFLIKTGNVFSDTKIFNVDNIVVDNVNNQNKEKLLDEAFIKGFSKLTERILQKRDLLILSWGGTYGSCRSATERLQNDGKKVSHDNLRWISPLPKDLGEIIIRFKNVLIPELNMGQLSKIIRADYLVDAIGLNLVRGRPFKASDIVDKAKELIG